MKFQQGFSKFKVSNYQNNNEKVTQALFDPNKTMRFDNKTDEEIVYNSNYKTILPIEILISNPEPRKESKKGKIPRRLNKWIIYRRDKSTIFKGLGLTVVVVTEKVREMWIKEPEYVKEFFAALSRLAVKIHMEKFGHEYKYKPGPYRKHNKRGKEKKLPSEESSPSISDFMDTISSSSESSPETPLLESMQQLPSDLTSGLQFFPTPESISDSPSTSSIPDFDFDDFDDDFGDFDVSLEQMFPSLPDISLFDANISQFPMNTEQLSEPEVSLSAQQPAASNFATPPQNFALETLLSTFTEEQLLLFSKLVQDNGVSLEENFNDVNYTTNDWYSDATKSLQHQELPNTNTQTYDIQHNLMNNNTDLQHNLMNYNTDLQHNLMNFNADLQHNLMNFNVDLQQNVDLTQADWQLFDSDINNTNFEYLNRQPYL